LSGFVAESELDNSSVCFGTDENPQSQENADRTKVEFA
jgi:hypothetical protein